MIRKHLICGLVIFVALIFAGCYSGPTKYTGGGWVEVCKVSDGQPTIIALNELFDGPCEDCGKATFGFQFKGTYDEECNEGAVSGQLEWVDHVRKIKFHGIVDDYKQKCKDGRWGPYVCFNGADCVIGTYRTQPTNLGDGGIFQLCVKDGGEPGPDEGDKISIKLTGGFYDGYYVVGTWLGGGNIQAHYDD